MVLHSSIELERLEVDESLNDSSSQGPSTFCFKEEKIEEDMSAIEKEKEKTKDTKKFDGFQKGRHNNIIFKIKFQNFESSKFVDVSKAEFKNMALGFKKSAVRSCCSLIKKKLVERKEDENTQAPNETLLDLLSSSE